VRDTLEKMKSGKFILIIGAMGSGKSSLMKRVISLHPELIVPYSYTTRARRADHIENDHYKFLSVEEFKSKIDTGDFLEWAEFGGNFYGTLKSEVMDYLGAGKILLKEMEVQGVRQVRDILPKNELITVFIHAGPWKALKRRALAREAMDEAQIEKRRLRYEDEITFMSEADVIIANTDGGQEVANEAFESLIQSVMKPATT